VSNTLNMCGSTLKAGLLRCAVLCHAGLKVSHADEERSCTDIAALFAAIDGWAQSVQPELALQPLSNTPGLRAARTTSLSANTVAAGLGAEPSTAGSSARQSTAGHLQREGTACAELPWCGAATRTGSAARISNSSAGRISNSAGRISNSSAGRISSSGSEHAYIRQQSAKQQKPPAALAAKQPLAQPGGIAAIAARLAAGCCPEAPYRQLQLLRASHSWVLKFVQLPRECDLEAGADLVTWDVGRHVFGEQEREVLLHEVRPRRSQKSSARQLLHTNMQLLLHLTSLRKARNRPGHVQ
jgi:hypothetical protein